MSSNTFDKEQVTGDRGIEPNATMPITVEAQPFGTSFTSPDAFAKEYRGETIGSTQLGTDDDSKLGASVAARAAREAFNSACDSPDPDYAENQYYACRDALEGLWQYAAIRTEAFRDLLGMVEVAIRTSSLTALDTVQRDVLQSALINLNRIFVSRSDVDGHLRAFAEHGIDITGPITGRDAAQSFRVVPVDPESGDPL